MAKRFGLKGLAQSQEVPIIQLGGFSEWRKAANAVWAFRNILNVEVSAFCLFDRDYKLKAEVDKFLSDMEGERLLCRVLRRKEIENYIFEPTLILRALNKKRGSNGELAAKERDKVLSIVEAITEEMRHSVSSQLTVSALLWAKKCGVERRPNYYDIQNIEGVRSGMALDGRPNKNDPWEGRSFRAQQGIAVRRHWNCDYYNADRANADRR